MDLTDIKMDLTDIRKPFSDVREERILLILIIAEENKCSKEETADKQPPCLCTHFSQG